MKSSENRKNEKRSENKNVEKRVFPRTFGETIWCKRHRFRSEDCLRVLAVEVALPRTAVLRRRSAAGFLVVAQLRGGGQRLDHGGSAVDAEARRRPRQPGLDDGQVPAVDDVTRLQVLVEFHHHCVTSRKLARRPDI